MKIEQRPLATAANTILVHNIAFPSGQTAVRKGVSLTERHLATLRELGHETVQVAVLAADDVTENEAAQTLAEALQTTYIEINQAAGGRVNLRAQVNGLFEVDAERLLALNMLPGIALATVPQHTVVGPDQVTSQIATLKIIPYAIPQVELQTALQFIQADKPLLRLRPFPKNQQAALLLTGEPAVHPKLQADFEQPIQVRLERLGVTLTTVQTVPHQVAAIQAAATCLAQQHDLLIVAGQTSIMDAADITPHALTAAGAELTVFGAPAEPGNMLALAYFPHTPVLCAPGCARSLDANIVDLLLPRLILGDRLERYDIAQFGLGGLLK